jgi:predicted nucleic acid-binding Zn ribbon protein
MVCKECGTYNAENLTECKVCGAKLKEDESGAAIEETVEERDDGKPARDFVKAPSWPTRAFTGAPEHQPLTASPAPEPSSSVPSGSFRPTIPSQAAAPAPAAFCPYCGKPAVADAPFCPHCGKRMESAAAPAAAAAPAVTQGARMNTAASAGDDFDDFEDDGFDDEYEEDYAPKKSAKRGGKMTRRDDDFEMDEYDDEFDDDYDEEFDDMPRKRGKGTTILFWSLIVLLLALIVVFGMYIAKKNFDGDIGKMFSSIGSVFNGNSQDVDTTDPTVVDETEASEMYTASISEYTEPSTGEVYFDIDIHAPTGSTIRFITDATLKEDTTTVPSNDHVILRIARDVFMPNEPVESETVTITPNIQVISPEGETKQLSVPDITVTVPVLSMTVSEPATDVVNATFDNSPIAIIGQVNDYDGEIAVFINDEQVYVDSTGMFTSSYTPSQTMSSSPTSTTTDDAAATDATTTTDDATTTDDTTTEDATTDDTTAADDTTTEDTATTDDTATTETPAEAGTTTTVSAGAETITIEARKNNCVTARKVITVEPYVMQNLSFMTTNEQSSLSSEEGSVTITGTATVGTKITATCPSTAVTFGEATVSATGTFSMAVSISEVGAFDITLTGQMEGYYDGTAIATVERPPSASSSSFKRAAKDLDDYYTKIVDGSVTDGDYVFTGKVTEIIASDPYTIFRVEMSDGTVVICANRSTKSTINSSDVGDKKQIAGTLKGLYTDDTTPYIWGWFIWNK